MQLTCDLVQRITTWYISIGLISWITLSFVLEVVELMENAMKYDEGQPLELITGLIQLENKN